jgi:hypothetical protein
MLDQDGEMTNLKSSDAPDAHGEGIGAATSLALFAHGKESGPWGSKITHLTNIARQHGYQVASPDYSDLSDPDERVKRLLGLDLSAVDKLVLVGSSMGGYVSVVASTILKPTGIFLMAPALYMPGYAEQDPVSGAARTCVVFGWNDEIIPVENGIRFAREQRASLHVFDSDHRLNDILPQVGIVFSDFLNSLK